MPALSPCLSSLDSNIPTSRAGMTLFALSGRYHGDDDDTVYLLWGSDLSTTTAAFKEKVLSDAEVDLETMSPAELEDALERVYVISSEIVLQVAADGKSIELASF